MSDEPTQVAEAEPGIGGEPASEPESAAAQTPERPATEAPKHRVFAEDGRHLEMDDEQVRFWAGKALTAAMKEQDSPPAASPAAEAPPEDEEQDPVSRQISQLASKLDAAAREITDLKQDRQAREAKQRHDQQTTTQRRAVDQAIDRHAEGADVETRQEIEDKAARIFAQEAEAGRHLSVDQAIAKAAKKVGGRLAAKHQAWLKGKQEAIATAPEGPGGGPAIAAGTTAAAAPTKEEQRKLAQAMTDGSATQQAMGIFREAMSQGAAG